MAIQFKSSTGFDYVSAATPLPVTIVGGGTGDVDGPASSTDNAVVRFDGTTGKLIQNSVLIVADTTGALSGFTTGVGITFHGGGVLSGASGSIDAVASGTNQSITLTPSGTGAVNVASHNILFDGISNGTGRLQFPAATTSAGGITFGTDVNLFRSAAAKLSLTGAFLITGDSSISFGLDAASGTTNGHILRYSDTTSVQFAAGLMRFNTSGITDITTNSADGQLRFGTGLQVAALTLDSSQNATFAGIIQGASTVRLNGAGNGTLISGTGNSRTMTLQTTTSGGTATNFLVADATQGVTLGSLAGTGSRAVLADANGLLSAPVSDETWKENIRALPDEMGLGAILSLRPLMFKFKDKSRFGKQDYLGFGARATSEVLPQVTGQDRDGVYYMCEEKLTAPIVRAIQQLNARLEKAGL